MLARTLLAEPGQRVLLVSDGNVGPLYADAVTASLSAAGFAVYQRLVAPGEASKSLEAAVGLYQALAEYGIDRAGVIVALGGGVVSDLAGFVAATWMRGVSWAVMPTTLEASVDACIGGKTAINVAGGKNLVGAFHSPVLVIMDPACLRSLSTRDLRAGLAESVKHALLDSQEFFHWHEENVDGILAGAETGGNPPVNVLLELIQRNVCFKGEIVARDPYEKTGARVVLNFGHTIGHAIESCCDYRLRHGECVALGMLAACRLSQGMGLLDPAIVARVERLLAAFGLPTRLAEPIPAKRALAQLRMDKKARNGMVRFVLLQDFGRPLLRDDVTEAQARDAYESLM